MVKAKRLIFDVKTMEQREEEFEFTPQISRDILKKEVERETERYISEKLAELDEDFVDFSIGISALLKQNGIIRLRITEKNVYRGSI